MKYSGTEHLKILKFAKNYNKFIISGILKTFKECSLKNDSRIFDFGSADGFFALQVGELSGYAVDCVEVDPVLLAECAKKGLRAFSGVDEMPDETADFIYSLNVLEHIEDDVGTLVKLHGKLKSGGKLYLYLPALPFLFSSMDESVKHYRRYTKSSILKKMKDAGFKIEKCKFADSLGVIATLIYKMTKNRKGDFSKAQVLFYDRVAFPLSRLLDGIFFSNIIGKNIIVVGAKEDVQKVY